MFDFERYFGEQKSIAPLITEENIKTIAGEYSSGRLVEVGDTIYYAFLINEEDEDVFSLIALHLDEIDIFYKLTDRKMNIFPVVEKLQL